MNIIRVCRRNCNTTKCVPTLFHSFKERGKRCKQTRVQDDYLKSNWCIRSYHSYMFSCTKFHEDDLFLCKDEHLFCTLLNARISLRATVKKSQFQE